MEQALPPSFLLSIIFPVFNEARRLPSAFFAIKQFIAESPIPCLEIIFVDDGSNDGTKQMVEEFMKNNQDPKVEWWLISYEQNGGKGYAVQQGMFAANGNYALMADIDMATPLTELTQCLPHMQDGAPIIIGSRKVATSILVKPQPWYRQKMGETYALLARLLTGLPYKDFGCGFKLFSQQSARFLFPKIITTGWIFDTEILYLAKKAGYPVVEVPVHWTDDRDTRVHVIKDIFSSLKDLLLIRFKH